MAYTNLLGFNPLLLSNDIEVRSGTSATASAIATEYVALGYEPGVGTTYLTSSGQMFIHHESGVNGTDWSLVTDVAQGETDTIESGLSLTAVAPIIDLVSYVANGLSLAASYVVKQPLKFLRTSTTLTASKLLKPSALHIAKAITLAALAPVMNLVIAAKSVTLSLSGTQPLKTFIKGATISLASAAPVIDLVSQIANGLSLTGSLTKDISLSGKAATMSVTADAAISVNPG